MEGWMKRGLVAGRQPAIVSQTVLPIDVFPCFKKRQLNVSKQASRKQQAKQKKQRFNRRKILI